MNLPRINRFTFTMSAMALIAGAVGLFLFLDLYRSQHSSRRKYADAVRGLDLVGELQYQAQEARRTLLYALTTTDSNLQVEYADQSRAAEAQVTQRLAEYEQIAGNQSALAAQVAQDWAAYLTVRDKIIAAMLEGDPRAAVVDDLRDGVPAFNALRVDLEKSKALLRQGADDLLREVDVSFHHSLVRMGTILGMIAVLGVVSAKMAQSRTLLGELRVTETRLREDFAQVQREERATAELFAAVLRAATEYSIVGTTPDGRITVFNLGAEHMLGYSADEAIGKFTPEAFHDPAEIAARAREIDLAPGFEVLAAAARRGEAETREWTYVRKDGTRLPVSLTVTAMRNSAGGLAGFIGIAADLSRRKAAEEAARTQQKLVETSRHAGMAEVATAVLHNVGNVLNSVNVSAGLLQEKLRRSKVPKLVQAADLLTGHNGNLAEYLTQDPNGLRFPGYLSKLGQFLVAENTQLLSEVDQLSRNVEHIKEVVAMQQSYAKVGGVFEDLPLDRLVEDSIAMNFGALKRHGVVVERRFLPTPAARVDRHKVLQILINLIRNAKYALDDVERTDKRITVSIEPAGDNRARLTIADNGVGIPAENLARIFGHGFTTRKDGHGFGLHSGALAAKEMGGSLSVHSDGLGRGAAFILELPIAAKPSNL